jgi:DNA-binding XRE family transcriptional regulator
MVVEDATIMPFTVEQTCVPGHFQSPSAKAGFYRASLSKNNRLPWSALMNHRTARKLRLQKEMTQEELAFEAEIDLTYVGGIERGRRNPSLMVLVRIAKALDVPPPKLLEG